MISHVNGGVPEAVSWNEYSVSTVPNARSVVVIVGLRFAGGVSTVIVKSPESTPIKFCACTLMVKVPAVVGMPVSCPESLRVRPGISPFRSVQDIGLTPEAVNVNP